MVYCGKPSRGCQMCRTRRIKCDETKPTCRQCQKSRRQCPGYKDDFDLVFRNETQATERRARRAGNTKKINTHISQGSFQTVLDLADDDNLDGSETLITPVSETDSTALMLPGSLSSSIEQQASCFFVTNFVRIPQSSYPRGSFDYLLPILKSESPDSHLSISFSAVALAALANRPNSKASGLMQQALCQYTKALKAINLALQNPTQQKSDATLASIILMGFFESVTSERSNVMAWGSHVDGAVQLIRLRGKKQLRTKTGHSLFVAVRSQMLISCMISSKTPMISTDWWISEAIKDEPGERCAKLMLHTTELRAAVNTLLASCQRKPEYFQKVIEIMRRCQAMDQEFTQWEDTLPESWRPKTIAWVDNVPSGDLTKAEVYPGRVDLYDDHLIAASWNHMRISRLFVSGLVIRCAAWMCSPVDYRTTPEYAQGARLGVDIVTDILASVPYHLGWHLDEDGTLVGGDLSGNTGGLENGGTTALGGFLVMWPLFCVNSSDFTTDAQRKWVDGRMRVIHEVLGLNQAKVMGALQMRLPSMSVRRDNLGQFEPTRELLAKWAAHGAKPTDAPTYIPITSAAISKICATYTPNQPQQSTPRTYALNPLQQREAMQHEIWERERKRLLVKGSNFGGDAAEIAISRYLSI